MTIIPRIRIISDPFFTINKLMTLIIGVKAINLVKKHRGAVSKELGNSPKN